MLQKCKIWNFLKIAVLTFFIISPVIFGLQRCTLPQIKALEILFWPCFIIFSPRINICWVIMSRICIILSTFFYPPFIFSIGHFYGNISLLSLAQIAKELLKRIFQWLDKNYVILNSSFKWTDTVSDIHKLLNV